MKYRKLYTSLFTALALQTTGIVCAQTAGDEDKDMFNRAQTRDKQALDAAYKGWWTASMKTHEERIQWWRDAKFGMFIHWGVYSLPAGEWKGQKVSGYAEHLMRKEKITRADYLELAHQFNPVLFNADEWVLHAKQAGMKYFIITAKHHDGFAMYDSKIGDFTLLQQTPFKRDPMAELAAACKKHGVRFGFYYSHAFDWEHPDAPGNDWEFNNPGGDKLLHGGANWFDVHPELLPKAQKYVTEKAIPQIKELLTKYHPDILWFDTPHKLPLSENIRILQAIRETDPNVVVNGRLVRSATGNLGDYKNTADRPAEFFPVTGDWEAIPTTNESYGYHKYDNSHKSVGHFIQLLAKASSRGGNLLMNIGPKGNGQFDTKDIDILQGIGKWVAVNQESVYGVKVSGMPLQNWGVTTRRNNTFYLHVFEWPTDGKLVAGGLSGEVANAYLLADPSRKKLGVKKSGGDLLITLPAKAVDSADAVVVVEMKGNPVLDFVHVLSANVPVSQLLAFDATLNGKGMKYGDGKTNRYYVEGIANSSQSIEWKVRTREKIAYDVKVRYISIDKNGGTYNFEVNGSRQEKTVNRSTKNTGIVQDELGVITLPAGVHSLKIQPVKVTGDELFKLLDIQLIKK